ncbi:MAG: hypothetical protein ACLFUJ_10180 [Phycisphaerae bacterium]
MPGTFIATMIIAMLSMALMIALFAIRLSRTKAVSDVVIVAALGLMLLGALFLAIFNRVTMIMGSIFWMIAWPGLAAGFVLANLEMVKGVGKSMSQAAERAQQQQQQ